jgi:hypothetical protein
MIAERYKSSIHHDEKRHHHRSAVRTVPRSRAFWLHSAQPSGAARLGWPWPAWPRADVWSWPATISNWRQCERLGRQQSALAVEGRGEIARAWSDPKGSRGEGTVLLPGGHLLVAKEKKPAAFIEFGPPHSRSRGLVRGGALADGERWPIKKGHHRFVALAIWRPDKTLAKTCADFSDLEIGPDGCLYLLSDKSSTIARLNDLPAGGGAAVLLDAWRLGDLDGKPEGLAFTPQGRAIVGLDTRKRRRNLVLLEPAVAHLSERHTRCR